MRAGLVHLLPAYPAGLEFRGVGIEPVLSGGQSFVLTDLATAAFDCVACTRLPRVRGDDLAQLLLALIADHSCRSCRRRTNWLGWNDSGERYVLKVAVFSVREYVSEVVLYGFINEAEIYQFRNEYLLFTCWH